MRKIMGSIYIENPERFRREDEDKFSDLIKDVLEANGCDLVSALDFTKHIDDEPGDNLLEIGFTFKTDKDFTNNIRFKMDDIFGEVISDETNFRLYSTTYNTL